MTEIKVTTLSNGKLCAYACTEWDWKESPKWDEINTVIANLSKVGSFPIFNEVNTESDSWGVVIADTHLLPEEVQKIWRENND